MGNWTASVNDNSGRPISWENEKTYNTLELENWRTGKWRVLKWDGGRYSILGNFSSKEKARAFAKAWMRKNPKG